MTKRASGEKTGFSVSGCRSCCSCQRAQLQLIEGLERFAYDWGVRASARTPSDRISVIAIDKRSIDNIGRWPWSRDIHAKMIEASRTRKPKSSAIRFFSPNRSSIRVWPMSIGS